MPSLDLSARVTCFVGENGSGKSTLLEGIAAAASLPTVGATEVTRDGTLAAQRLLTAALRLTWAKRTHRGFFLRAEDFFGFQRRLAVERQELEQRLLDRIERDAQVIVATHSPILLAFPGARIYSFDRLPIEAVAYGDLDHVALTRAFLNDPETFLRRLHDGG